MAPQWVESGPLGFPTGEAHLPTTPPTAHWFVGENAAETHSSCGIVTVPFQGSVFTSLSRLSHACRLGPGHPSLQCSLLELFQLESQAETAPRLPVPDRE